MIKNYRMYYLINFNVKYFLNNNTNCL